MHIQRWLVLAIGLFTIANQLSPAEFQGPMGLPYKGKHIVSSGFYAQRHYGTHKAFDVAMPEGTPIYAVMGGNALYEEDKAVGKFIILKNGPYKAGYCHLKESLLKKRVNTVVRRGQLIGYSGNTGYESRGAHLHFFIEQNGVRVHPQRFFDKV